MCQLQPVNRNSRQTEQEVASLVINLFRQGLAVSEVIIHLDQAGWRIGQCFLAKITLFLAC